MKSLGILHAYEGKLYSGSGPWIDIIGSNNLNVGSLQKYNQNSFSCDPTSSSDGSFINNIELPNLSQMTVAMYINVTIQNGTYFPRFFSTNSNTIDIGYDRSNNILIYAQLVGSQLTYL